MKPACCPTRPAAGLLLGLGLGTLLITLPAHSAEDDYRIGTQGEVLDDRVLYSIGGGSAAGAPSSFYRPGGLGAGLAWRANLMCGHMDLATTLQNQLNGVTAGFQQIMGSVVQSATQAVMSLPALIIQRANPGLYELLSNGVMQGRIDFDRSKLSCQALAGKMADQVTPAGWGALSSQQALQDSLEQSAGDAVTAVKSTETRGGNQGLAWVGGQSAGGSGQPPIEVTADVVRAGYNLLHARAVEDSSALDLASCQGGAICGAWSTPQAAVDWSVRVLGETQIATCDTCQALRTTAGTGLTPLIQETYARHLEVLQALIADAEPITAARLAQVSSPLLPVTRGVIEALRDDPDQALLARRLASETALSSVIDQALQLQRLLLAGSREPNVQAAEPAQQALGKQLDGLERELRSLELELQLRQLLARNTASQVLERQEAAGAASRAVQQRDPEPQRLRAADEPQGAAP